MARGDERLRPTFRAHDGSSVMKEEPPRGAGAAVEWARRQGEALAADAGTRDHDRVGEQERASIFRDHSCYRCKDGTLPCVRGEPHSLNCEFPHARND
jgi:hypothetical protein